MPHTQDGDNGKAAGEPPGSRAHECESLPRETAQLPRQNSREEIEHANGKPGSNEEVPVRAREPLYREVRRLHRREHGANAPCRVRVSEAESMANSEEE